MFDSLIIGIKSSFDDFEASVKTRTISKPKKKSIRETVPFSNLVYDFSGINGEIYWEERELEYVFEIIADTPEQLEEKKKNFASWVMNVFEQELHDPFIKDYYFKATFDDIKEEDEEHVEKTTITVIFKAYPYMIAIDPKVFKFTLSANVEKEVVVLNESSHRITPTIEATVDVTVTKGETSYGVPTGTTTDDSFKFESGTNTMMLKSSEGGEISFTFIEEVF